MGVLYTIGHGTRSVPELLTVLNEAGVGLVVDVRRHPGSRRSPHLARDSLDAELPPAGVDYEWWGEELGGRRTAGGSSRHPAWRNASFRAYAAYTDSAGFREAFDRLLLIVVERPTAIMCAETLWWRCHRRLIADAAVLRGVDVVHLLGPGQTQPHPQHPSVRADGDGWPVYDVGTNPQLFAPEP